MITPVSLRRHPFSMLSLGDLGFAAVGATGWSRYSLVSGIAFVVLGGLGAGLDDWRLVAVAVLLGWSWVALVAHRLRSPITEGAS